MINKIKSVLGWYYLVRKYRQVRRVLDFIPLVWNGFDFDYRSAIDLFKKQLERMADEMESDRMYSLDAKHNASRIRTAVRLMDKVYNEEYAMEYIDRIEQLYGKTRYTYTTVDGKSNNDQNIYELKLRNERAVDDNHQDSINEIRREMSLQSYKKQERAHKLLWNFIEHNIRDWWD